MLAIPEALELTKKLGELVKAGATIGLKETIMELREAVLNVKDEVLHLRENNQALRAQVSEKSAWDEASARYTLVATPTGGTVYHSDGPPPHYACPTCHASRKIIPLQHAGGASIAYQCPQCKAYYPINERQPIDTPRTVGGRGGPHGWMGT